MLSDGGEFMRGTFEKTGLPLPLDGTEDDKISFDGSGVHPISVDSDEDSDDPETEFAGVIDSSDHRISFKQQKILSLCDYDSSADDMDV